MIGSVVVALFPLSPNFIRGNDKKGAIPLRRLKFEQRKTRASSCPYLERPFNERRIHATVVRGDNVMATPTLPTDCVGSYNSGGTPLIGKRKRVHWAFFYIMDQQTIPLFSFYFG